MRGRRLVAVLLCTAQAMAWAGADCARAEPSAPQAPSASPTETAQAQPADPVVVIIRAKLADPAIRKWQNAEDLAALESFYGARTAGPLWMTDMGFSARGQAALFEIDKADEWGLEAKAFTLPQPGALPADLEAQALAEIVLDLAILKYVRFAQGGRFNPAEISELFD
ncbi:MAG: hypothetical protein ACREDO_09150, partial [Methyloceanibacter sp.]